MEPLTIALQNLFEKGVRNIRQRAINWRTTMVREFVRGIEESGALETAISTKKDATGKITVERLPVGGELRVSESDLESVVTARFKDDKGAALFRAQEVGSGALGIYPRAIIKNSLVRAIRIAREKL